MMLVLLVLFGRVVWFDVLFCLNLDEVLVIEMFVVVEVVIFLDFEVLILEKRFWLEGGVVGVFLFWDMGGMVIVVDWLVILFGVEMRLLKLDVFLFELDVCFVVFLVLVVLIMIVMLLKFELNWEIVYELVFLFLFIVIVVDDVVVILFFLFFVFWILILIKLFFVEFSFWLVMLIM